MVSKKILIIQLRRVGDVIFTLPVIEQIRKNLPDAQIDFLVEKPSDQFVRLSPDVNETLVYNKEKALFWIREIRKRKYDWVLDFLSNGRTVALTFLSGADIRAGFEGALTRKLAYNHLVKEDFKKYIVEKKLDFLKSLGLSVNHWNWNIKLPLSETEWAEKFFKESGVSGTQKLIGIAPVSRRPARRWISERFAEVTEWLAKNGHTVLFLWGLGEEGFIRSITEKLPPKAMEKVLVPPNTSLLQLSALIQRCSLVLALDNGPKNMAVAFGVPTVTLIGPTNPLSFNPHHDPKHIVLRDDKLSCITCEQQECPTQHECMKYISTEMVIGKIEKLII